MSKLFAPADYGDQPCTYHEANVAFPGLIEEVTGGCGPGGFGDYLVPDKLWGLSVWQSCSIHDWMYAYGLTAADKEQADRVFRNNMYRQVKEVGKWMRIRCWLVQRYYKSVKIFGGSAFWNGKNKDGEMQEVGDGLDDSDILISS